MPRRRGSHNIQLKCHERRPKLPGRRTARGGQAVSFFRQGEGFCELSSTSGPMFLIVGADVLPEPPTATMRDRSVR